MYDKIAVVEKILKNLKLHTKKQIYVFNKGDAVQDDRMKELSEQFMPFHPQCISAKTGQGVAELVEAIQKV